MFFWSDSEDGFIFSNILSFLFVPAADGGRIDRVVLGNFYQDLIKCPADAQQLYIHEYMPGVLFWWSQQQKDFVDQYFISASDEMCECHGTSSSSSNSSAGLVSSSRTEICCVYIIISGWNCWNVFTLKRKNTACIMHYVSFQLDNRGRFKSQEISTGLLEGGRTAKGSRRAEQRE